MKLSTKIAASMGTLAALMAILGCYLITELIKSNTMSTTMAEKFVPLISLSDQIKTDVVMYRLNESYHIFAQNAEEMAASEREMDKYKRQIAEGLEKIGSLSTAPAAQEIAARYLKVQDEYYAISKDVVALSRALKPEEAMKLLRGKSAEAYKKLTDMSSRFAAFQLDQSERANHESDIIAATARNAGITTMVISLLIAIALTILIVRNTIRQLGKDPGELNSIARRVVEGDYNVDDGGKKQGVYGAIVEMVNALKSNIDNAQRESENARKQSAKAQEAMAQAEAASKEAQAKTEAMLVAADKLEQVGSVVSSASTELSAQIEQSDRGAAESAQRLSEAATAMNEMNATVQEVAKNAGSASAASADTKQKAEAGAQVVEKAMHSIEQVHQMSLELKDDMAQLNAHAQDITRIMGVISDIADQTNLLALNAAIEAARAGDAGRGFAVVADEVRKLAEKTMASTNDVGNAIKAIQESTAKSMTGVDNAVERIGEATELAGRSGRALEEIVSTVELTADQVNAIATASEEQSAASEEINHSIVQVNDMAKQTADAMAEAAKAVSDLAAQAQGLTNLIQELKEA